MPSFRQKMAIQKQQKIPMKRPEPVKSAMKVTASDVKTYILRTILMYKAAAASFEPLSDEEKYCRDEILKYTIDLETLERGTYEERKEVIKKYG